MSRCPHTMKAEDRDGTVYCCDCGKALRRSVSTEETIARAQVLADARHREKEARRSALAALEGGEQP